MAECPRCGLSAAAYTRCDRCGLMLGFDGLTVLIDFERSSRFECAQSLAQRQPSYSEWTEENGHRYLHVTYSKSEKAEFDRLAAAAAPLARKHVFLNGMEIPWPAGEGAGSGRSKARRPAAPRRELGKNSQA
jgi:hypothetical protein